MSLKNDTAKNVIFSGEVPFTEWDMCMVLLTCTLFHKNDLT